MAEFFLVTFQCPQEMKEISFKLLHINVCENDKFGIITLRWWTLV